MAVVRIRNYLVSYAKAHTTKMKVLMFYDLFCPQGLLLFPFLLIFLSSLRQDPVELTVWKCASI